MSGTPVSAIRIPERLWLSAASRLVSQSTPNREAAAKRLVTAAPAHGIDLGLMWGTVGPGLRQVEAVRQVVLAVPGAGRTLMLFVSEPGPNGDQGGSTAGLSERVAAISSAFEHFSGISAPASGADVRLAQGLPEPRESWAIEAFQAAGFIRVGDLAYLRRALKPQPGETAFSGSLASPEWPDGITVRPFSSLGINGSDAERDRVLIQALESSYAETLDCPELCGLRETADVLASHRATGVWDPKLWWVVFDGDRPLGCVLLNRCPDQRSVELVYLGLAPALRGRGIASKLLCFGAAHAQGTVFDELTCAVDRRNRPALELYRRAGFRPISERIAFVKPIAR